MYSSPSPTTRKLRVPRLWKVRLRLTRRLDVGRKKRRAIKHWMTRAARKSKPKRTAAWLTKNAERSLRNRRGARLRSRPVFLWVKKPNQLMRRLSRRRRKKMNDHALSEDGLNLVARQRNVGMSIGADLAR